MSSFSLSGGVEVMGYISPTDTNDTYPVIDPLYGIDGFRNVNLISDLNSIPEPRRRAGMVVGISGGTTYYKLNSSPWNYTISDWSLFNTGGGSVSGNYLPLSGGTVTGNTVFTLGVSATTISATTYQNLPTDIRVTGGTYSNGTTTFRNNTGGTFNVTGYYTGSTDNNQYTTGFTYNNNTFTLSDNSGTTLSARFNSVTGLTVNGVLSATTYQNLPQDIFVTGGTYTNGEILFKNNSGGYFTVTGLPIGGAGGEVYYLNLSQTQTPYKEFSPTGTNLTEQTTGVTINSGVTSTIASFLTPVGYPNTTTIPAGYWSFYIHSYKDVVNASFDVFCEVYVYTTGGTETLILTTEGADVTTYSPTISMELTDGYYSGGTIDETDRILVKLKSTNTGTQTNTLSFFTEGQQHYSYGITPFSNFNALTCETLSGCTTIVNLENNKVNKSGDTMVGTLYVPTISATTYQNLPIDPNTYVTGYTYNSNTFTIRQNNGQPNLTSTINSVTGLTVNGNLTVTGNTYLQGLTATTISATTYQNLPTSTDYYVTGGTYNYTGGTVTLRRNDGNDVSITGFNYNDTWTVELINALSVDFYAPYNLSISSVTNILGSPTITLYDDNVSYSLGAAIGIGSKITVVASVTGVTNLNLIRT
jgi:hypothetical protein